MASPIFKDDQKREWNLSITVATIKRVRDAIEVDIGELLSDGMKPLQELLNNPSDLVDVCYCICEQQCKERNMSDEDFGQMFSGQVLDDCAEAFLDALELFYPPRKGRGIQAARKINSRVMEVAEAKADAEVLKVMEMDSDDLFKSLLKTLQSQE